MVASLLLVGRGVSAGVVVEERGFEARPPAPYDAGLLPVEEGAISDMVDGVMEV